jgi:hypothetical protein
MYPVVKCRTLATNDECSSENPTNCPKREASVTKKGGGKGSDVELRRTIVMVWYGTDLHTYGSAMATIWGKIV